MRDKHDLNAFGFAQQLPRHMGWPSAAGMAASSLPLIGGAVFLLGPAAAAGGPAVIGIGWPLLGLFGLLTASSAAAFASTVPTAGGCYHWAMASGSRRAGLWSGWLHAAGSSLLLATTNLYLADWMSRTVERHFGYTGGAGLFYIILLMLIITQAAAHIRAIRLLGRLMAWTAAAQLAAAAGMIAILTSIAWPGIYPFAILAHASPAWTASAPPDGGSSSALLGFLLLQRLFIGIGDGT